MELQNDNLQDFFIKMDEALAVNETLKTSLSLAVDALLKVCGETEKQLEIIRDWTSSEAGDVTLDNGVIIPNATKILEELRTKTQEVLDTIPPTLQGYKEEFKVKIDELIATKTQEIESLKNDLQNKVNENIAKHDEAITEDREAYETLKADLESRIQEIEAQAFLNEFKVFKESVNQTIASLSAEVAKLDDKNTEIDTDITSINEAINQKDSQNVKLTGNQSISDVKTFTTPPISENNPSAGNQVAKKAYVDSVSNTKVALSGNQTIAGNKTFSGATTTAALTANGAVTAKSTLAVTGNTTIAGTLTANGAIALNGSVTFKLIPNCAVKPTGNNHLANKLYVDNLGGVITSGAAIDFRKGNHFLIKLTANAQISVANWGGVAGKSGTITILNANRITGFRAPFNFRIAQSGFSGTEVFSYYCYASNLIRIVRM